MKLKYGLFALGFLFSVQPVSAGTVTGKVCRVTFAPASLGNNVGVGLGTPGVVCPPSAANLAWMYFYGPTAPGVTIGRYSEAELQSTLSAMGSAQDTGKGVTISYEGTNQAIEYNFIK